MGGAVGGLCSRCSELKKVDKSAGIRPEDLEDEVDAVGSEDDRSEADLQSEVGETPEDLKEGIQKLLEETGRTLERGRTLALKEAIGAAKKNGVRKDLIKEAERRLEHHQLGQKRQESEVKVSKWLLKDSRDLEECERLLEEAVRNQCDEEMRATLQRCLAELKITRPLDREEAAQAKEYVVESCRDFVSQAIHKGRPSLFLDLDEGSKCTATLYLNPPLQVLSVKVEDTDDGSTQQTSQETFLKSITTLPAKDDKIISQQRGFLELEHGESHHCAAVRCQVEGCSKVWCFVENSVMERDRLIQALRVLSSLASQEEEDEERPTFGLAWLQDVLGQVPKGPRAVLST